MYTIFCIVYFQNFVASRKIVCARTHRVAQTEILIAFSLALIFLKIVHSLSCLVLRSFSKYFLVIAVHGMEITIFFTFCQMFRKSTQLQRQADWDSKKFLEEILLIFEIQPLFLTEKNEQWLALAFSRF